MMPIHGFVLAGGQSSRMGQDKATLLFRGQPMIAVAVATLGEVCEYVSIAGNRDDLAGFAAVTHEAREQQGPAAGLEAGLSASQSEWTLFTPVDTPLMPVSFLRAWARAVLDRPGCTASYIRCGEDIHPALCLIHRSVAAQIMGAVTAGQRRVRTLLEHVAGIWIADATLFAPEDQAQRFLLNLNTPEELDAASKL